MTEKLSQPPHGKLVVFEGIDGCGKSTQAQMAVKALNARGMAAVYFKEPTDGPHGRRLRELMVAGRENLAPMDEFRLFLDDRAYDIDHNIRPALERGAVVCLDRYYISSMAYQGALGLDIGMIQRENEKIAITPDLIIYLRVPVKVSISRIHSSRSDGQNLFEEQLYLQKVHENFEAMDFPQLVRLDGTQPQELLHGEVMQHIERVLSG